MKNIFFKKVKNTDGYFDIKDDASRLTEDYEYRHGIGKYRKMPNGKKELGAFRWKGIFEHFNYINKFIKEKKCLDFGGAACPISKSVPVLDLLKDRFDGGRVEYNSFESLDYNPDFIFSSHCLEHIQDINNILYQMNNHLSNDGVIFLHLPAYSCKRWRPSYHKNKRYGDHVWSFTLSEDNQKIEKTDIDKNIEIDVLCKQYFNVTDAKYCGDNSIIIIGKKK